MKATLEVIKFDLADVITTSTTTGGCSGNHGTSICPGGDTCGFEFE